nr:MAG TPA: tail tape measure [Caudoviricetes sp.]
MAEDFKTRIIVQDDFSGTVKKFQSATEDVVDSAQRTGSEVEKASSKIGRLKSALSGIRGKHKTEVQAVGLSAVEKNVASIQSQIERLTNKPAVITAQAKLTRDDIKTARAEAKELQRQLKDLTGQKYDIKLDLDGQEIQSFSSKLKGGLGTALSVAGGSLLAGGIGAAAAGIGSGVASAASTMWTGGTERQQYLSSMTHFMGGDQSAAREMMDWANENARTTQFSSGEVLAAASRAIQIADGSATEAQRLTALAEDMASLTPGKTVMDAMEALADAQMGEFERMKEFGFKGSADAFEAAGGDFWSMQSTSNGKTVEEMFAGGTASGAQNATAKIGTIAGTFEDALASAGEKMINGLNPALDWLIEKSEGAADALGGALEWAGTALGTTFTNVQAALQPYMPLLSTLGNIVGTTVTTAFEVVGSVINGIALPAIEWLGETIMPVFQPLFDKVGTAADRIGSLGDAVKGAVDKIGDIASSAWDKISGLGSSIWDKITGADKHATGAMAYGGVTQINENMKGELIRLPNGSRIYPYETTRRLLQNELRRNGGSTTNNVIHVNIDARGSTLTKQEQYRLRKEIVRDLIDAFDNTVPA